MDTLIPATLLVVAPNMSKEVAAVKILKSKKARTQTGTQKKILKDFKIQNAKS